MGRIASFFRLVRAARVFARHEVLLPPELREMAPFPARFAAGFLKLTTFSRTSKGLSTGQRFAAALGDQWMGGGHWRLARLCSALMRREPEACLKRS